MDRRHAIDPIQSRLSGDAWIGVRLPDTERGIAYNTGGIPIALRLRWGGDVVALGVLAPGGSLSLPASPGPDTFVEGFGNFGRFWVQLSRGGK